MIDEELLATITLGAGNILPTRDSGGDAGDSQDDATGMAQDATNDDSSQDDGSTASGDTSGGDKSTDNTRDDSETRKLKREAQRLRKERNDLAEQIEAARLEKLSESEKAKEEADRAKRDAEAARAEASKLRLQSAVEREAAKLKFHDPSTALALLPADAITIGDDGSVEGVEAALKELAEDKPFLVDRGGGDSGGAFGASRSHSAEPQAESEQERRVRLGLSRPTQGTPRFTFDGGGVIQPKQ